MRGKVGVDAVLFDYGGVLTTSVRDSLAGWMAREDIEPGSFTRTLRAWLARDAPAGTPVHRLETGELALEAFEETFAAELRTTDGRAVPAAGLLDRLFAEMRQEPTMFALVDDLRARGVRTGLVSNSWGNDYPRAQLDTVLDPVVISADVGLRKPDVAIFDLAVAHLGVPASRVLFVDDAEPNLIGARRAGLQTLLHQDPGTTRRALDALLAGGPRVTDDRSPHD
ncbi:HAD family phosphatase [Nocardioides zeae]|uniref:HAD family hydrolase n=1 Tax=Nocardioides zeae TaxID=1457234 RepID=UPI00286CC6AF|nr:HAD family phosphatase [Nocardioides zeae]